MKSSIYNQKLVSHEAMRPSIGIISNLPHSFSKINKIIFSPTTKDIFQPTPSMSTYLLAFTIHDADFTCTSATTDRALTHQVCSRKDEAENRALAMEASVKLLNTLDVYTEIPLSGLGKLDHLAIPDISTGASENWGLVKYRYVFYIFVIQLH